MQDDTDAASLYQMLETEELPMYHNYPNRWLEMIKNGMKEIITQFDSNRMAKEYYEKLYLGNIESWAAVNNQYTWNFVHLIFNFPD